MLVPCACLQGDAVHSGRNKPRHREHTGGRRSAVGGRARSRGSWSWFVVRHSSSHSVGFESRSLDPRRSSADVIQYFLSLTVNDRISKMT